MPEQTLEQALLAILVCVDDAKALAAAAPSSAVELTAVTSGLNTTWTAIGNTFGDNGLTVPVEFA